MGVHRASRCIESSGVSSFDCHKNVPSLPGLDVERVLFAGHSMGGHGSWVQFIHNPDRAIGAVSIAIGWIRKEAYGDSNRFLLHDIGHSYIDPAMKILLRQRSPNLLSIFIHPVLLDYQS